QTEAAQTDQPEAAQPQEPSAAEGAEGGAGERTLFASDREEAAPLETAAPVRAKRAASTSRAPRTDAATPLAATNDPVDLGGEAPLESAPSEAPSEVSAPAPARRAVPVFSPNLPAASPGEQVRFVLGEGVREARIQLNPPELGEVDVNLRFDGERVLAELRA
ncbi:MAG TPA: hypothetical protein DEA08_17555, partial [Planctomycetes bacterium]|nr:hypothetical protein [Planctomycetota bacterium]